MKAGNIYEDYLSIHDIPSDEFIKLVEKEFPSLPPSAAEIMDVLIHPNCFGVEISDLDILFLMSEFNPDTWEKSFLDFGCMKEFYRDHFEAIDKLNAQYNFDNGVYASFLERFDGIKLLPRYFVSSVYAIEKACMRTSLHLQNKMLKAKEAKNQQQKNKGIKR